MNILQDIFFYFAKFPAKAGVLKNFNRASGSEDYNALRNRVDAMEVHSLYPLIADYLIGTTDEAVKKKIQSISGIYMFIDYGVINTSEDSLHIKSEEVEISITLAKPISSNQMDQIEYVLLGDQLLKIIAEIRELMRMDRNSDFVRRLTFPTEIIPYNSTILNNSFGWSMIFRMRGVELI